MSDIITKGDLPPPQSLVIDKEYLICCPKPTKPVFAPDLVYPLISVTSAGNVSFRSSVPSTWVLHHILAPAVEQRNAYFLKAVVSVLLINIFNKLEPNNRPTRDEMNL